MMNFKLLIETGKARIVAGEEITQDQANAIGFYCAVNFGYLPGRLVLGESHAFDTLYEYIGILDEMMDARLIGPCDLWFETDTPPGTVEVDTNNSKMVIAAAKKSHEMLKAEASESYLWLSDGRNKLATT